MNNKTDMEEMELNKILEQMKSKMNNRDLSDEYLKQNGNSTRREIGIGEYAYGITMIPCSWVYPYLKNIEQLQNKANKYDSLVEKIKEKLRDRKTIKECETISDREHLNGEIFILQELLEELEGE